MPQSNAILKISQELKLARQAESEGNQGKARVCARRAAGWAIQEHLSRQGTSLGSNNALDHIKYFSTQEGLPQPMYAVLHHLTVKLEKDSLESDAYYPIEGVDLMSEAQWLAENLLQTKLDLSP